MERGFKESVISQDSKDTKKRESGSIAWIPDEEVKECPLCSRAFGISNRKHHCRACGRVVCGRCSDQQLYISGQGKKERVCDSCYDLRRHDKSVLLTENQSSLVQVEQSLKADLMQKHHQAEWFRSFLVQISSSTWGHSAPPSTSGSPRSSVAASDNKPSACNSPRTADGDEAPTTNSELQTLITGAKKRWKETCAELKRSQAGTHALLQDCERAERVWQKQKAELLALKKQIRTMEADLQSRTQVSGNLDQIIMTNAALEQDLQGLNERKMRLEAIRPSPGGSFLSNWSSNAGSFRGSLSALNERASHCCENRCRQQ